MDKMFFYMYFIRFILYNSNDMWLILIVLFAYVGKVINENK
jgi:hypothetical protein